MKMIDRMIEHIEEELDGAKEYAEKYIEHKAKGDMQRANKYKEMASDELRHASYVHEWALVDIENLKKVYTIPVEAEDKWMHAHKHFVECMGWIRQMIS